MEKAESLVDQIQEVQEGAGEGHMQKQVTEDSRDFVAVPFPSLDLVTLKSLSLTLRSLVTLCSSKDLRVLDHPS